PHHRANFDIADKRHDDLVRVALPTIGYAEIGVGDPQFVKGHETGARGFMQEEFVAYRSVKVAADSVLALTERHPARDATLATPLAPLIAALPVFAQWRQLT